MVSRTASGSVSDRAGAASKLNAGTRSGGDDAAEDTGASLYSEDRDVVYAMGWASDRCLREEPFRLFFTGIKLDVVVEV